MPENPNEVRYAWERAEVTTDDQGDASVIYNREHDMRAAIDEIVAAYERGELRRLEAYVGNVHVTFRRHVSIFGENFAAI